MGAVVLFVAGVSGAAPASAEQTADPTAGAWCGSHGSCDSFARVDRGHRRTGGARDRDAERLSCVYHPVEIPPGAQIYDVDGKPVTVDGRGRWYDKTCTLGEAQFFGATTLVYVPERSPEQLRDEAFGKLRFPQTAVATNPPADAIHLVNVETWLHLADRSWNELTSTVSVPGVAVTVKARPVRIVWDMGTGDSPVVCYGPGNAYGDHERTPECSYRWPRSSVREPGGVFRVRAAVEWQASWAVEGAVGGGDLGVVSRPTELVIRVGEGQARGEPA